MNDAWSLRFRRLAGLSEDSTRLYTQRLSNYAEGGRWGPGAVLEFEQAVYAMRQLNSAELADAKRELERMRPQCQADLTRAVNSE